ncbi:MAG: hypothetical protein LC794_12980 [Acidobacteria bacterium]|nr:hypothetical protein [Acidobacteriota bacterium]MCA1627584.1 hypothetical protein [Acidobacteriota bacterium]
MKKSDKRDEALLPTKEPMEMTSDELLEYALDPELADEVKRLAKPPEDADSERDC